MITWMTRQEAADHLRVSVETIDRYARDTKLTKYTVAGTRSVRFKVTELDALITPEEEDECEHPDWTHRWEGGKPQVRGDDVWRCANCEITVQEIDDDPGDLELICGHTIDLTQPINEVIAALYTHFDDELNGSCGAWDGGEAGMPCPHGSAICAHV